MSDYNTPTLATAYATFLSALKDRDVDAITLCLATPSNAPVGTMKWNRGSFLFQEWDGALFNNVLLALAGGGTGSSTAAGARTNLGLGSMAVQNSNAVNITGGAVAADLGGSTDIPATGLSGLVPQANLGFGSGGAGSKALFDDQTFKTISPTLLAIAAVQSADFTAALETAYPLTGSHTVTLPTVVGNAGKRICLINRSTGSWTVNCNGAQTILGSISFTFNLGQYSSIILQADANSALWDII